MSQLPVATERGFFSGSLLISLGLHAAVAAMVLFWGGFQQPRPPTVLTVSLVAPGPEGPGAGAPLSPGRAPGAQVESPRPQTALRPEPGNPLFKSPQKPKRPKPKLVSRIEPEKDLPVIPQQPAPPPVVPAPKPPSPVAVRPDPAPSATAAPGLAQGGLDRTTGPGQAGAGSRASSGAFLGYGQGVKGGGAGGTSGTSQANYVKLIRSRILAKRTYPHLARQRHQEGVVHLRFTLYPAGTLSQGVQVVKPSGFDLLDEQARQCVLAAAPFPPFPLDLARDRLTLELPIIYKLADLDM